MSLALLRPSQRRNPTKPGKSATGIALDVNAISAPVFPLTQAVGKNLLYDVIFL